MVSSLPSVPSQRKLSIASLKNRKVNSSPINSSPINSKQHNRNLEQQDTILARDKSLNINYKRKSLRWNAQGGRIQSYVSMCM